MVEQLRARQALWFAQRAAEQEKDSVLQQLQSTGLMTTSTSNSHLPASVRSEDVLDQLTQRITVRLRSELQAELQKSSVKTESNHRRARQQIEGSLFQEIESHTCPICYELMVAPQNAPILLFPCGHTFCSVCIQSHTQRHKKRLCPCCREVIQSQAPNVSLQQLIASFAAQSRQLGLQPAPHVSTAEHDSISGADQHDSSTSAVLPDPDALTASRLQSQMTMLTMRCRVLQNELVEGQQEQQAAQATMLCLQHALHHQKALEHATTKQLQEAQAQAAEASAQDLRAGPVRFSKQGGSSSHTFWASIRAVLGNQINQTVFDNHHLRHAEASQRKCAHTTPHQD
ncbi:hypothetical protein WJX79_003358 [Trebouxia sp. C0005]